MEDLIKIENGNAVLECSAIETLVLYETSIKKLKEEQDKLKQAILEEMQNKNIIKIDTDRLTVNYIAETARETFDSKEFRKEHEELYNEYIKLTSVKPSIRLRLK